ncbi:hypothetical protein HY029_05695 [Candidatus Gottesmanbacteria bacterium]|nr:hypothetical protein [Candidatus Gottesmanbacteria bacterium]
MKWQKVLLFLLILPVTLILDFILYSFTKACPACGSFTAWLETEGALSFPLVVGLSEWFGQVFHHSEQKEGLPGPSRKGKPHNH